MVVSTRGEERRGVAPALHHVEAEHAVPEADRALDVRDLEVDVADVHAGVDRHAGSVRSSSHSARGEAASSAWRGSTVAPAATRSSAARRWSPPGGAHREPWATHPRGVSNSVLARAWGSAPAARRRSTWRGSPCHAAPWRSVPPPQPRRPRPHEAINGVERLVGETAGHDELACCVVELRHLLHPFASEQRGYRFVPGRKVGGRAELGEQRGDVLAVPHDGVGVSRPAGGVASREVGAALDEEPDYVRAAAALDRVVDGGASGSLVRVGTVVEQEPHRLEVLEVERVRQGVRAVRLRPRARGGASCTPQPGASSEW